MRSQLDSIADSGEGILSLHSPAYEGDAFFAHVRVDDFEGAAPDCGLIEESVVAVTRALGFDPDLLDRSPARLEFPGVQLAHLVCAFGPSDPRVLTLSTEASELTFRVMGDHAAVFNSWRQMLERPEIVCVWRQTVQGVPVEHSAVMASWMPAAPEQWFIWGSLLRSVSVVNELGQFNKEKLLFGLMQRGVKEPRLRSRERDVVMFPVASASGDPVLRYAYRVWLSGDWEGIEGAWLAYTDADTGDILALKPFFGSVEALGRTFLRAPDLLPDSRRLTFQVDPAQSGSYVLRLERFVHWLDLYDGDEVAIPADSSAQADFDRVPINDGASAVCAHGGNRLFQQVNVFAKLYEYRQKAVGAGIFTPFPPQGMTVLIESPLWGCNAWWSPGGGTEWQIGFGDCPGYTHPACPTGAGYLNPAHDNTAVAHEMAHAIAHRLGPGRPADWCGQPGCPLPTGAHLFHDFADGMAAYLEETPCIGGWIAKNLGGANQSLNCPGINHDPFGSLPRLLSVAADPSEQRDVFPHHRRIPNRYITGGYADGQIAGAALWEVWLGMRSKCPAIGPGSAWVRLIRALRTSGFVHPGCDNACDQGIYRYLVDLELQLLRQWASAGSPDGPPSYFPDGPHSINKVTAGFARAGICAIPYQCLDGNPQTNDPSCPEGEAAPDAVIDVDDGDERDDEAVPGAAHLKYRERDWLRRSGPPPSFEIWTGPPYVIPGTGDAVFPSTALCNSEFQVELSASPSWQNPQVSGWQTVNRRPGSGPQCYARWSPSAAQWDALRSSDKLYYRVRTRAAGSGRERLSTRPAAGLFGDLPAPFAVINVSGLPEGCRPGDPAGGCSLGGVQKSNGVLGAAWPIAVPLLLWGLGRQLCRRAGRSGESR